MTLQVDPINKVPSAPPGSDRKNGCCISDCLSRIWQCVVKVLTQFVNWLCCRPSKTDQPEISNPIKPPVDAEETDKGVPAPQETPSLPNQATSGQSQSQPAAQPQVVASSRTSQGNVTAAEFVKLVDDKSVQTAQVQEFIRRGGILNFATKNKPPVVIRKNEQVIAACNAGVNRSQSAAAVLADKGIHVAGILSAKLMRGEVRSTEEVGISSLFIKSADQCPRFYPEEFYKIFGQKKRDQMGREFVISLPTNILRKEKVKRINEFFQQRIDKLDPTHFVTFADGTSEVLKCLLKRPGKLENFAITHVPMQDWIQMGSNAEECNQLYQEFAKGFKQRVTVENTE